MLEAWREFAFKRDYPTASWESSALLDDSLIRHLALIGPITSIEQVKRVLATRWAHWIKYGHEIFNLLSSADVNTHCLEDHPVHSTSSSGANERPLKRPRLYAPSQTARKRVKRKEKLVRSPFKC